MTIIAPLLFSAVFMFAAMATILGISIAMPRIAEIFKTVHGSEVQATQRKITVYLPVSTSAEIVPFPTRPARQAATAKLAA